MAKTYFAEVRDIMDPTESGRVKVRIYGHHDNEQNVLDADLPWALPLQPITSAGTGKVGTSPVGLLKGSRVVIMFMDNDVSHQYPVVLGSFSRAGLSTGPTNS